MSKTMREVSSRLCLELLLNVRERKEDSQLVLFLDWDDLNHLPKILGGVDLWLTKIRNSDIFVHDRGEHSSSDLFKIIKRVVGVKTECHDIGGIPFLVELKKILNDRIVLESFQVSSTKSVQDRILSREGLE